MAEIIQLFTAIIRLAAELLSLRRKKRECEKERKTLDVGEAAKPPEKESPQPAPPAS